MDGLLAFDPDDPAARREAIGRIDYLLDELRRLLERGMVPPETVAAVEAEKASRRAEIERLGLASDAIKAAHVAGTPRLDALEHAERARAIAPERLEGWGLSAAILGQLGQLDRAIDVCREGAELHGHSALLARIEGFEAKKLKLQRAAEVEAAASRARVAANVGQFEEALAACGDVLEEAPDRGEILEVKVRCLAGLGRLDEAESACQALRRVSPTQGAAWSERLRTQRLMQQKPAPQAKPAAVPEVVFLGDTEPSPIARKPAPAVPEAPAIRWSSIAAEFLEEHWQKLILSLAVLLIVVSSTVGAALVLGDRLWMAEGKCLLATAYTLMFAGFGRGLAMWGAERAGRIMRLTTLLVLPVNFALVGELPGLGRSSSPTSLAVLAIDTAAMMGLAWLVCRSLGIAGGRATPAALIAMGMLSALTPRSASFEWGFAAMIAASVVFAASGEWLGRWLARRRASEGVEDDAPYFAAGLLALYYLGAVARIGGYVLHLIPTLYALPAMLAAFAAVRVADGLKESGRPERLVALIRLAGYSLSALAFALGLTRPEERLSLYSGNTLAVALLGLWLYARALRVERRPAFLYAGFAALFLAYFGIKAFLIDLITPIEGAVGQALGYGRKLPDPFKALNGLAFNAGLAGLSVFFGRRWNDARLAKHCMWIGLPVSLAACALSALEPIAALLTMGGYTVAYPIGAWIFAAPALGYLACAAFSGAAVAASTTLGDLSAGAWALALATVGLVLCAAAQALAIERVPVAYRVPVVRSSRAIAAVALAVAAYAAWPWGPQSWTIPAAFWLLAVLYFLIGREAPLATVAYAAVACGAVAALLTIQLAAARRGLTIRPEWLATSAAALGAAYQAAAVWLGSLDNRFGRNPGGWGRAERAPVASGTTTGRAGGSLRSTPATRVGMYPVPLFHLGVILAALAAWLAGWLVVETDGVLTPGELNGVAASLALVSIGLAIASAWTRRGEEWVAQHATLAGGSAAVVGALALGAIRGWPPSPSGLALACGGVALALAGIGDRLRGVRAESWRATYRRPVLATTLLAVALAWLAGAVGWEHRFPLTVTLTLTALALALATRQAPVRPMPDLALAAGLMAWLVGRGALGSLSLDALPRDGLLVMAYLIAALAAAEVFGLLERRVLILLRPPTQPSPSGGEGLNSPSPPEGEGWGGGFRGPARKTFAAALPEFAGVAALAGLGMAAVGFETGDFARLTLVLTLAAALFFWLPRFRRDLGLVHFGLVLAWLATGAGTRWASGASEPGIVVGWLALATAVDGLVLCGLRAVGRRRGLDRFVLDPLRDLGIALALAGFALGIAASVLTLDAYPTAVTALVLTAAALAFSAAMERTAWRVTMSTIVGVSAAYLSLFELGRGRQGHVAALGVLASLLAVVVWTLERLAARERWREWRGVFAAPLANATIALAMLAVPFEWDAVGPLVLASLPFLLLVRSRSAAGWLYPALLLVVASGMFAAFRLYGLAGLAPWGLTAALACWALGLAAWRWKLSRYPEDIAQYGLRYEHPPYHMTIALAAAVLALRVGLTVELGVPWSSAAWVPAAAAMLALLMLKPYPHRAWVDGSIALLCLAAVSACDPWLDSAMALALAGLGLASIGRLAGWGAGPVQGAVCRRLGVGFDGFARVLGQWSLGLLALATIPVAVRVGVSVLSATLGVEDSLPPTTRLEWWIGISAIVLFGVNLWLAVVDLVQVSPAPSAAGGEGLMTPSPLAGEGWGGGSRGHRSTGLTLFITATLLAWWLAIPASPIMTRLDPTSMIPLATAALGLVAVAVGTRRGWRAVAVYGFGLALVAVVLTGGRVTIATTATLFLATAAVALLAVADRRAWIAGIGSALWGLAMLCAAFQVALFVRPDGQRSIATFDAAALAIAALGLVVAGGWDRRRGIGLARVMERFAVGFLAVAAACVGVATLGVAGPIEVEMNVAIMFATGSLCMVLATRWGSIALAFGAQASILLGYVAFRAGFASPPMGDAAAILILAGVDLGIAEVAGRGRRLFALPALATGLALPLISVGLAFRNGPIGDEPLFVLFAAGTFYAATCGRMRWKTLGYAAALLYNAALWVLWARFGWKLAEAPQFYVVPVGFSTILFAEVNRRELGRSEVNAIRGVGLTLIYLALAFPIWQTASLAAWATVLGVSLAGIFAGIGLRSQSFLWLGLAGFVLDVVYQLGRIGLEHALAKWAIMLALGIALVLFVALNEKKRLLETIRKYVEVVRQWE
jgi:tetratricopeptide (TPR) repeat protein